MPFERSLSPHFLEPSSSPGELARAIVFVDIVLPLDRVRIPARSWALLARRRRSSGSWRSGSWTVDELPVVAWV
jgi:hypothetical protein